MEPVTTQQQPQPKVDQPLVGVKEETLIRDPQQAGENQNRENVLFSWTAPVRPFKARDRKFFSTVVLLAALLSIIGFVIEGFMVVVLVWAVVFLVFVLFSVKPEDIDYEITTRNIKIAGKKYPITEISRFWITERWEHELLVFEMPLRFPGRLELVLSRIDKEQVKEKLEDLIPYEEEAPGFADKAASWLSKRLSLNS